MSSSPRSQPPRNPPRPSTLTCASVSQCTLTIDRGANVRECPPRRALGDQARAAWWDPLRSQRSCQLRTELPLKGGPIEVCVLPRNATVSYRDYIDAGGLVSHGTNVANVYRQAGTYAGRILKGEKPSELPVTQPTTFELVINMRAAKTLGLIVPYSMQILADEVIE